MTSITIRNLGNDVKACLQARAAAGHRRSMEEVVRTILREAVNGEQSAPPRDLARFTRECFAPFGGVALELSPRSPMREPSDFS